jgi:hypothetical protein
MVKKPSSKGSKKAPRPQVIQPESWTGYPVNKPCNCPLETLRKTAGGGKGAH